MNELIIPGFSTEPESGIRMNRYGSFHYYSYKASKNDWRLLQDIEDKMYFCLYGVIDGGDFPCLIEASVLFEENNE